MYKRTISQLFETVTPTTQLGFYLFKVNNRNTKITDARCEICLKIIVRTTEQTSITLIWCLYC